jgi:hypothetical protein
MRRFDVTAKGQQKSVGTMAKEPARAVDAQPMIEEGNFFIFFARNPLKSLDSKK